MGWPRNPDCSTTAMRCPAAPSPLLTCVVPVLCLPLFCDCFSLFPSPWCRRPPRFFKANIDPDYEWEEDSKPAASSASSASSASQQSQQSSYVPPQPKPQPQASSSPRSPSSAGSAAKSPYGVYLSYAQLALHLLIILNVLTFLLPILGADQAGPSFFRVMVLNAVAQMIYLYRQHGRPQWNAGYGQRLLQDEQAHYLFLSVVLMNAQGSLLLVAPFLIRSALFVAGGLNQLLPSRSPRLYALAQGPLQRLIARYADLYRTNALLEVLAGFMMVFQLFTPARNLMMLFGFGQYLRIRAMLDSNAQAAWAQVRARTDVWMSHPMVPVAVRGVYEKLKNIMHNMVDQEALQAAAQQPGIMSKCTIM